MKRFKVELPTPVGLVETFVSAATFHINNGRLELYNGRDLPPYKVYAVNQWATIELMEEPNHV